jgi:GTP diphosphokinase / guanosine-3',5'-bis(diphosphate) 3'-diphosphatase
MVSTTNIYPKDLEALLENWPELSPNDRSIIERAYHRAEKAHEGQKRKSGEPYFTHCVAVANILGELKLDAEAIAAGLLHDVIEDTAVTYDDLLSEFGADIAKLVDGVTKLAKLPIETIGLKSDSNRNSKNVNREMEYFRKMLLTMDADVRVVLVKLADRLHNMRTLGYMPEEKQRRIAEETMDIFAPLANRLGIWQIKWELEDLSFRYLQPDAYRAIARSLDERRADREAYVARIAAMLRAELEVYGIKGVQITGRPKHMYSIYKKMKRKDLPLEQIYDIRALRVIVPEQHQCYLVLGVVHKLFRPIPGEFDDYIAAPKDNFYRSLHTAVLDDNGRTLEVQIRTLTMHEDAEFGIAAHWRYKEGRKGGKDKAFEERISYLRRLMDMNERGEEDAESFMSRMKAEVFEDRVYAFTPKGDIVDLPEGATPIDFAYHIHTDIGHRCRGARIQGKLVPLSYQLRTGDQVEIIVAKRGGPSMDWLNLDLGYAKTSRARSKIRHWFRRQNRDQHISMGRAALEREMKRLGVLDRLSFETVANLLGHEKLEDFLASIGAGDTTGSQISQRVLEDERRRQDEQKSELEQIKPRPRANIPGDSSSGVNIMGTGGLLVNIAKCCSPMPGDDIAGFVTRGRGVTVHRADCVNMQTLPEIEKERLIDVSWGSVTQEHTYVVPVEIIAQDREGLLRDISTLIADERINITSVEVVTRQQIATLYVSLQIGNNQQLTRILNKIETVPNVYEARRTNQKH